MDKYYEVTLDGKVFKLPKASIGSNKYIAVFDPYCDIEVARAAANALYKKIKDEGLEKVDVIIGAEVKGASIAQRIADLLNTNLLIFRKNIKINFEDPVIAHVKTFTSGTNQLFIDRKDLLKYSGKNALFVDDVISTGSTINATKDVLKNFNINVKRYCTIFKEGDELKYDVLYVDKLPIFSE